MLAEYEELFIKIESIFKIKDLPKLKTLFKGAITNISNLSNILVRKSILKENLYNYNNQGDSKFYLPEEKNFQDDEKSRIIYDRIKALMNALEYQASNIPSEANEIADSFLENTRKLLSFFSFHNYNSANCGINTKTLKSMTDRLIGANDQIIRRIVLDNLKLLSDNFIKIEKIIESLIQYKREKYKAYIRLKVFPYLTKDFTEDLLNNNPSAYLNKLARFMHLNTQDIPFVKHWIMEAIKSCYNTENPEAFKKFQNMFASDHQRSSVQNNIQSTREKLLVIIDIIANSHDLLEKMLNKIEQNINITHNRKKNLFEQIAEIFKKAMNTDSKEDFFQLEYINPSNREIQQDTININDFITTIKKKISLFTNLQNPTSSISEKIRNATEEALYKFMEDTYFELLLTKERIIGIDAELRIRVPKMTRPQLKEISDTLEKFDQLLKDIADHRRKYVSEHDGFAIKKK